MLMKAYLAPSGKGTGAAGGAAGVGVPCAGAGRGAGACGAAAWANVGAADSVKLSAATTARPLIRLNPFTRRKCMILLQIHRASNIGERAPHRFRSPYLMSHSIRVVFVLLPLALVAAGCGSSSDPTLPTTPSPTVVTETFAGTV